VSSSTERKKNRIAIWGTNVSAVPTPAMTPSTSSERSGPAGIRCPTSSPKRPTHTSMKSIAGCAHANTDWNTAPMSSTKIAGPNTRCVSTRSIASLRASRRPPGERTVAASVDWIAA
jgi:hypothetical protein